MLTRLRARRLRLRRRGPEELGAIAVIFALTVTFIIFPMAALSVDLGNAFARRTDTQTQADYGALAAARLQTETAKSSMTIPTAMANAVRDAMNANQPQDDSGTCWTAKTCVTTAQLVDDNLLNGEVRFCSGTTCGAGYASTVKGIQVIAPQNKVDYGFANVMGVPNGNVTADALVNVFTAGKRVMPMYAVTGCDYGLQTLADPANGHTSPVVPTLAHNSDTNITKLQSGSVVLKSSAGTPVVSLTFESTGNTLTVDGSKWSNSRYIGFFRADDPDPALVQKQSVFWLDSDATKTNLNTGTGYTQNAQRTVTLNIPDAVTQTEAAWWIRVFEGPDATGKWSPASEALPIRVGSAVLQCAAGSSAGNFGTLIFPREDVPSGSFIPANIALGLQKPLTPEVHQWAVANPSSAGLCAAGLNGAVTAPMNGVTLVPGVNCVDTDTGLAANFATEGLVQGGTYGVGSLRTQNTRNNCDPNGGSSNRNLNFGSVNYSLNDDVLSCYFTNGTTSIADIAKANYTGGVVLDAAILKSPRFFYVPVLAIQPATGGSVTYSIIDFRAAFLTDETATTTAIKGSKTGTNDNGLYVQSQNVEQLKVVFFNDNALPIDGDIPIIDYLGSGQRVIRLID